MVGVLFNNNRLLTKSIGIWIDGWMDGKTQSILVNNWLIYSFSYDDDSGGGGHRCGEILDGYGFWYFVVLDRFSFIFFSQWNDWQISMLNHF